MRLKKLVLLPIAAVLGLGALACTEGDTHVNTPGSTTTGISVNGTGKVFGSPDVAKLQIGVQAEAQTVAEARETAAATATAIVAAVKRNGVADRDVQTQQFSVQPVYDFSRDGNQSIRAYRVDNVLAVTVRKIDTTGKVIDDAIAAGGDNAVLQGISFTIDDPRELREGARREAVAEAKEKAEQLAAAAGVKLGKLVTISEVQADFPQPIDSLARAAGSLALDTATPIETGELQVSVTVNLLYAIE